MQTILVLVGSVIGVLVFTLAIVTAFLRSVDAGEILLVSSLGGKRSTFRGPCKAFVIPLFNQVRAIPSQAINVDIDITDQTADLDPNGKPAPVKVTVKASAIVSVGETDAMVNTAANKFFSKTTGEQLATLTDVLSSAGRRAINLLKHDQLFNARTTTPANQNLPAVPGTPHRTQQEEDDELAIIIKEACSRELMDLGLIFNSLNIKGVASEVAEARRREAAARAKASADVVQAQEEQRARIAQLEAQQKVNDQERLLQTQIAANGATIARAEAEKQVAMREQREAELNAGQLTQARADAQQNIIRLEAEGRAEAAKIIALAEAEAESIRKKTEALQQAGNVYLELRKLELTPDITRQIAGALSQGQFVNFGSSGNGGQTAASTASDDVMRVVQTLLAAKVINEGMDKPTPAAIESTEVTAPAITSASAFALPPTNTQKTPQRKQ
jgi:flotillin